MLSKIIGITFNVYIFSWISSAHEIENVIDMTKKGIDILLLRSFPNISLSPLWLTHHTHTYHQQEGLYISHEIFLFLRLNPCI